MGVFCLVSLRARQFDWFSNDLEWNVNLINEVWCETASHPTTTIINYMKIVFNLVTALTSIKRMLTVSFLAWIFWIHNFTCYCTFVVISYKVTSISRITSGGEVCFQQALKYSQTYLKTFRIITQFKSNRHLPLSHGTLPLPPTKSSISRW